MHLKKVAIINFRSCRNVVLEFGLDSPTTIIGINDAGKTILLKSIGHLLENEPLVISKESNAIELTSDKSNTPLDSDSYQKIFQDLNIPVFPYSQENLIIIGELIIQKDELDDLFKEKASKQLQWTIEGNSSESIYILKIFSSENQSGSHYILCHDQASPKLELWKQTQADIKKKVEELEITKEEIKNDNEAGPFKNLELSRSIYKKIQTQLSWAEYPDFQKKDRLFFPSFRYLDWNISMKAIEGIANDAFRSKIEEFTKTVKSVADQQSVAAGKVINEELAARSKEIFTDLSNIKGVKVGINFDVKPEVSDVVIEKNSADGPVRLESQGEGVKKQIWFAFLRWNSLLSQDATKNIKKYIWCFDEPEVHLFPSAQRELFEIIKNLSTGIFQTVISTHSTIFIDRVKIEDILQISLDNGYSVSNLCTSVQDIHDSLKVKNSDILFFDKFIAVEGETEYYLLPHLFQLFFNTTLEEKSIQLIPLGGSKKWSQNKKILESIMKDFLKTESMVQFLLDKDTNAQGANISLIGQYDFEDCVADEIWKNVIERYCGFIIDISEVTALRKNLGPEPGKKFYKLLGDLIQGHSNNSTGAFLPSKGRVLAEELAKVIKQKTQIPDDICSAFLSLSF